MAVVMTGFSTEATDSMMHAVATLDFLSVGAHSALAATAAGNDDFKEFALATYIE